MSNVVSGLLSQKPDSPYAEPAIGDTRGFSVTPTPKKNKPGETWNKLKNDREGTQFKILKADRLADYEGSTESSISSPSCSSPCPRRPPPPTATWRQQGRGDRPRRRLQGRCGDRRC